VSFIIIFRTLSFPMLARYMLSFCACPSVCLSQADIVSKRLDESNCRLLPPTPHCTIRKSGYLQKLGYFHLSHRRRRRRSSLSYLSYTTVDESWLFTTSRSTVTLWLHYCCTTRFYSWQDFNWHSASRGSSAVSELLVWLIVWVYAAFAGGIGFINNLHVALSTTFSSCRKNSVVDTLCLYRSLYD